MKRTNNITWGLFNHRLRYFWKNFRDISIFFKRIVFVLRHGYSNQARWETFAWFIDVMREILTEYRNNRCGTPMYIENYWDIEDGDEKNIVAYNAMLDEMLECLDKMDEANIIYKDMSYIEAYNLQLKAKDRFFELFSNNFYAFWD